MSEQRPSDKWCGGYGGRCDLPPNHPGPCKGEHHSSKTRVHELKTWPEFFARIEDGTKTFELRKDDRGFRAGDTLVLREWNFRMEAYTGNELRRVVTYVMSGPAFGLMKDWVAMGLAHETSEWQCAHCGCPNLATITLNVTHCQKCERIKSPAQKALPVGYHCTHCGADLSNHPTSASAHKCSPSNGG